MTVPAVVMNMFYTGLGIARSLGENGVPVIGLTSSRRVYGSFTRYARILRAPDSRNEPEALLAFLLDLGAKMKQRCLIWPTRDDDVLFLDRFRSELEPYFLPMVPASPVVRASLDKWETYQWAVRVGVPTPKCWLVENEAALQRAAAEAAYPCVLKPIAAHQWRQGGNWELVGGRKAIRIDSRDDLFAEYATIARADKRALLQELIPGGDENLSIAACCLDRESNWIAGFNTRKLVQIPEGFGTGCIVQAADFPQLFEPTRKLLQAMRFTGIAEVEYKWNPVSSEYQLIEINPRPWDQHRLGKSCGTDLVLLAYREWAGMERLRDAKTTSTQKWIAEDAFIFAALTLLWRNPRELGSLLRLARGRRTYAVWSLRDPLPMVANLALSVIPRLAAAAVRQIFSKWKTRPAPAKPPLKVSSLCEGPFGKENTHV